MSDVTAAVAPCPSEHLQGRILALGQAALDGSRPLSDLLGEAFRELRSALATIREQEAELRRKEDRSPAWRREVETGGDHSVQVELLSRSGAVSRMMGSSYGEEPPNPPTDLVASPLPGGSEGLEASLRTRIATAQYLGVLHPGDRLPSIRELARRTGLNHKVVRRVYRALERSGAVEVRDRSGTYVPDTEVGDRSGLDAIESWVAGVLVEAIRRGVTARDLPGLLEQAGGARGLKCCCVESTEDDRFALCHEIRQWFGLETVPVGIELSGLEASGLEAAISDADVVVTTPFHAHEVRRALAPDRPLVVASLHAAVIHAVRVPFERGATTLRVVCVDPASGERLLSGLEPDAARSIHMVPVESLRTGAGAGEPAVATLAAWARLGGGDPPAELHVPPYLSLRTVGQMASLLVGLNRRFARAE